MRVPTVFIGSSTEQLKTARALKACLGERVHATVWDEANFGLNDSIFGGLLKAADQYDFAVFVFDADDIARVRHAEVRAVRDNVVFEFGLFTGRMGRGRTFWISAQGAQAPHIPTDLAGIIHLTFQKPKQSDSSRLRKALEKCCERLRLEMEKLGIRGDRTIDELDGARVLCVASSQYSKPKFAKDIKQIQDNFPAGSVKSAHGVNAQQMFRYFSRGQVWDIVHFAMYVDPTTGDLIVPRADGKGPKLKDRLPIAGVENLIQTSSARLVVIVTCDSLVLGTRIGRITNTIAGYKPIDVRSALDWSAVFYHFLAQGCPLSESFNRARDFADPGLVLISKRDFRLTLPQALLPERQPNQ